MKQKEGLDWIDLSESVFVVEGEKFRISDMGASIYLTKSDIHKIFKMLKAAPQRQPLTVPQELAGVSTEQRRLIHLISDKIEDGTLFQSGIYSRKDLARFVRDMLEAAPQAPAVQPLTDEQIRPMCKQSWVFETVKQWVRAIEAAHGIKG